jgi:hypothetical protein
MTRCAFVLMLLLAAPVEAARLEDHQGLPVVYVEGEPYELGRQHGELLREPVRQMVTQLLGHFRNYLKIPLVRSLAANWWLDGAWNQARPFLPKDYREELRGLADGSGVPLKELERLHSIPDRTYACSGLAAWGKATTDGRLIHTRNLDWNIEAGIQRHAAVFVVRPRGKHAYVSAGWAGFLGVLTGVNEQGLSIGQIGAETDDLWYRGVPMVFLMRQVLEDSDDLDEAVRLITDAPRTVGVNYVLADAQERRAVAIETTRSLVAVFEADDPKEHQVPYARPMQDAVFRADTALDAAIRDRQIASGGDPKRPGPEPPTGSAYEVRYLKQAEGIRAHYGRIDAARAREIAQSVAPDSNVQSVVFAWPMMWVANAEGSVPAAQTTYHELNLDDLRAASRRGF